MEMEDINKKITKLTSKIITAKKDIEAMEISLKQKRLEMQKYKNERAGLKLKVKEFELANWKTIQEERKQRSVQRMILSKYAKDPNSEDYKEYYSQAKNYFNKDNLLIEHIERSLVPYND